MMVAFVKPPMTLSGIHVESRAPDIYRNTSRCQLLTVFRFLEVKYYDGWVSVSNVLTPAPAPPR